MFYHRFILSMDRSPGFGSTPCNFSALLRLGFPTAPALSALTSLHSVTRWPVLQKVRSHPNTKPRILGLSCFPDPFPFLLAFHLKIPRFSVGLLPFVSIGFQVLFHSPPGVLFTFPSRYFFAIGHQEVFSLGRWSSPLPTGFLVSRGTLVPAACLWFSPTRLLPSLAELSNSIRLTFGNGVCRPATPNTKLYVLFVFISFTVFKIHIV